MQISQTTLANIQTLKASGQYAAAYSAIIRDLNSQGLNLQSSTLSAADHDSLQWVTIAQQVNSGAVTAEAVEIRAVNKAAVQYELGQSIDLFGPEEQASSNAVANAYLQQVINNNGNIPSLTQSINGDVTAGLGNGPGGLGVSLNAHAAALPDGLSQIFTGFDGDNYYDGLSTAGQQEANFLHIAGLGIASAYNDALLLGYSPTEANNIATTIAQNYSASQNNSNSVLLSEETFMNGIGNTTQAAQSAWSSIESFSDTVSNKIYNLTNGVIGAQFTNGDGAGTIAVNGTLLGYLAGNTPALSVDASDNVNMTFAQANAILKVQSLNTTVDELFNVQGATNTNVSSSGTVTASDGTAGSPQLVIPSNGAAQLQTASGTITLPTQSNATSGSITLGTNAISGTITGSDGTYTNYQASLDGSMVNANQYNTANQLIAQTTNYTNGGVAKTIYSTNANDTWQSQTTAYNDAGQQIAATIIYKDGSATQQTFDPTSGDVITTVQLDNQNHIIDKSYNPNAPYTQVAQAFADTLASQLISQVLIKNNLPASIATTAFADAVIKSHVSNEATTPGSFTSDFAQSVFDIAGGLGGSLVGTDIAKALGIPTQLGSLAGGVSGNLVTQSLVQEAGNGLGIFGSSTEDILTAANFSTGIVAAFGNYTAGELASLIIPTNLAGEVTGAVASAALVATVAEAAVAVFEFSPVGAVLAVLTAAFGGNFIGTLVGDLFGGLFGEGYRGPPYAEAHIGMVNGQFQVISAGEDNNGNTQVAITMANMLDQVLNSILASVGGTASFNGGYWSVGYHGSNYHSEPTGLLPHETDFPDATSATVAGIIEVLRQTTFTGSDPYKLFALEQAMFGNPGIDQNTLNTILNSVNAAGVYEMSANQPLAFIAALVGGGEANFNALNSQMSLAQSTGSSNLSPSGNGHVIFTGTFGQAIASQIGLQALNAAGLLDGVMLTDGLANGQPSPNQLNTILQYEHLTQAMVTQQYNVVGKGADMVTGDNDLVVRNADGTLSLYRFNASAGVLTSIFQFSGINVETGAQVMGFAPSVYTNGNYAIVTQLADGSISFDEQSSTTGANSLHEILATTDVAAGAQAAYIGKGLTSTNNLGLIFRNPSDGSLRFEEFTSTGQRVKDYVLSTINVPSGSLISGVTTGLYGTGNMAFVVNTGTQAWYEEFTSTGAKVRGIVLTNATLGINSQVIGIQNGAYGSGDIGLFVGNAVDGSVRYEEFNSAGTKTIDVPLAALNVPAGSQITGLSTGLFGSGDFAFIVNMGTQAWYEEYTSVGQKVRGIVLANATINAGSQVIGLENSPYGSGNIGLFVRNINDGSVRYEEFSSSGTKTNDFVLLTTDITAGMDVIGLAKGIYGVSDYGLIASNPVNGTLRYEEFTSAGVSVKDIVLAGVNVPAGSQITGITTGLLGAGNLTFVVNTGSQLWLEEFTSAGVKVRGVVLANATTNASTQVIGIQNGVYGTGDVGIITRNIADGSLRYQEFNSTGALVVNNALTGVNVNPGSQVLGIEPGLHASGNVALVIGNADGSTWYEEFTSTGAKVTGVVLASPTINPGAQVVDITNGSKGSGNIGLTVRNADGSMRYEEFTSAGQKVTDTPLPTTDLGVGTQILDVTKGINATGDIGILATNTSTGALRYEEFTSTGVRTTDVTLSTVNVPAGSQVTDLTAGLNGGNLAFIVNTGTQAWYEEFTSTGAKVRGTVLSNATFGAGMQVVGIGSGPYGSGDIAMVTRNMNDGTLQYQEFTSAGTKTLGISLASLNVEQGAQVTGIGAGVLGTGNVGFFVENPDGSNWYTEFTSSGQKVAGIVLPNATTISAANTTLTTNGTYNTINENAGGNDTIVSTAAMTVDVVNNFMPTDKFLFSDYTSITKITFQSSGANSGTLSVYASSGKIAKIQVNGSIVSFKASGNTVVDPAIPTGPSGQALANTDPLVAIPEIAASTSPVDQLALIGSDGKPFHIPDMPAKPADAALPQAATTSAPDLSFLVGSGGKPWSDATNPPSELHNAIDHMLGGYSDPTQSVVDTWNTHLPILDWDGGRYQASSALVASSHAAAGSDPTSASIEQSFAAAHELLSPSGGISSAEIASQYAAAGCAALTSNPHQTANTSGPSFAEPLSAGPAWPHNFG